MSNLIKNYAFVLTVVIAAIANPSTYASGTDRWDSLMKSASEAREQGDFKREEDQLRQAAVEAQKFAPENARLAGVLAELATALAERGQYREALSAATRSLDIRRKIFGPKDINVARGLDILALVHDTQHEYDLAAPLYKEALSLLVSDQDAEVFCRSQILAHSGANHLETGDYGSAEKELHQALAGFQTFGGYDNQSSVLRDLARVYIKQRRFIEAQAMARYALALMEKFAKPNNIRLAFYLSVLAESYSSVSQYDEAIPFLQRELALTENGLGGDNEITRGVKERLTAVRSQSHLQQQRLKKLQVQMPDGVYFQSVGK